MSRRSADALPRVASARAMLLVLVALFAGALLPRPARRHAETSVVPRASQEVPVALPRAISSAASRLQVAPGSGPAGSVALHAVAELPRFGAIASPVLLVRRRTPGLRATGLPAPSSRAPPLG